MAYRDYDYIYFEWDDTKSQTNEVKHGLNFETAHYAFFDPNILSVPDDVVDGEQRWRSVARMADSFVVLYIGHLYDSDDEKEYVRIITARQATPQEKEEYYANH